MSRVVTSRRPPRAAVVGSGPNGLAAAVTLARAGWRVTVFEASPTPGGAVRTAELTLPGFHHDVASAVHPAGAASPVFARWPLARHGLEWVHPELPLAHPLDDGSAVVLARSLEETAARLDAVSRGDGARWAGLVGPLLRRFEAVRGVLLGRFPPVGAGARLLARVGPSRALDLARIAAMPARGLADELFAADAGRAWLYGSALHGDVGPGGAGSAVAGVYLKLMGHAVGWPSPRGGAGALTGALVSYLEELGGEVRCGAPVRRVGVAGGRVVGVELAGGERVAADAVVCAVTPRALAALAGHALPSRTLQRYRRFRYGPGAVKIDWALDGPVPWAAEEARRAGTVHLGGSAAELARAVGEVERGVWPERPFVLAGSQSVADPTRAPAGKHTAWAYTRVVGVGTTGEVEAQAERVEAQVERFAPEFGARVLARSVQGPGDLAAGNANLVDGDVGGGSLSLDQVVFRPVPGLSPYRTGVAGLYIGSASTFPGPAVHGVGGWAAARAAIADRRARSPLGRAATARL